MQETRGPPLGTRHSSLPHSPGQQPLLDLQPAAQSKQGGGTARSAPVQLLATLCLGVAAQLFLLPPPRRHPPTRHAAVRNSRGPHRNHVLTATVTEYSRALSTCSRVPRAVCASDQPAGQGPDGAPRPGNLCCRHVSQFCALGLPSGRALAVPWLSWRHGKNRVGASGGSDTPLPGSRSSCCPHARRLAGSLGRTLNRGFSLK